MHHSSLDRVTISPAEVMPVDARTSCPFGEGVQCDIAVRCRGATYTTAITICHYNYNHYSCAPDGVVWLLLLGLGAEVVVEADVEAEAKVVVGAGCLAWDCSRSFSPRCATEDSRGYDG